jgi:hypothetical protein
MTSLIDTALSKQLREPLRELTDDQLNLVFGGEKYLQYKMNDVQLVGFESSQYTETYTFGPGFGCR